MPQVCRCPYCDRALILPESPAILDTAGMVPDLHAEYEVVQRVKVPA
jgi:hypothetical protein